MSKSERKRVFAFGIIFVVALLVLAIIFPNPSYFQYTVFRIVLALAAAGVAAFFPGFIEINIKPWLRAGGAIAVFVIVYFFSPANLVTQGAISVSSSPDSASIYIDGNLRGITPMTIKDIDPGYYTITLKLSGYEDWSRTVRVVAGDTIQVSSKLNPIITTPILRISANPTAVTASSPISVTFTVRSDDATVSGAHVILSGSATGSGITDESGVAVFRINATLGTITATASKIGYNDGTVTILAKSHSPNGVFKDNPPTVSINISPKTVNISDDFTVTVTGTDDIDIASIWWFGVNTGDIALDSAHWYDCTGRSCTNEWLVSTNSYGTLKLCANSRDSAYTRAVGGPHQASEGAGIACTTVTVNPN